MRKIFRPITILLALAAVAGPATVAAQAWPSKPITIALTDVLGNQVSMMFAGFPPAMPHVQAGKLNAIGMSTRARLRAMPEVRAGIEKAGMTVSDESRPAVAAFVKAESAKSQRIIKEAGIKEE